MESSPSIRRITHRSEEDYSGCMGGLVHLFDFNQALAGRKLLTVQKSGAGHEPTKNGSEASIRAEVSKLSSVKNKDVQLRNELPTEIPVKALIARDLSKESNARDHAPSVVARLMGLEALPVSSKATQKTSARTTVCSIKESISQKPITAQCYEEKPPYSATVSLKKEKAQGVGEAGTNEFRTLPFRNHPKERQLQEFKKDFEAWQRQKSDHSRRPALHSHSVSHTTDKHVLSEKMHKRSLAGNQGSSKIAKSQERLDESREILDAMNFLQSNHEFFAKFIEDSKSLLPWRAHESGTKNIVLPYPSKTPNAKNLYPVSDETTRVQPFAESSSFPRSYRFDPEKGSIKDVPIDSKRLNIPKSQFECNGEAFDLERYSRYRDLSQRHGSNYQVPTRIVVLKPSPGRVRDVKSVSPTYALPTKENVLDNAVIEKLRENLRKSKERMPERRNAQFTSDEVVSKDPRQIAREIARQVRENITGNQMMKSMNDFIFSDDDEYSNQRISNANDLADSVCSSDRDDFTPINILCHQSSVTQLHQDKKFSLEVVEKERMKDASLQSRKNVKSNSNEIFLKANNMHLRNEVYYDNTSCQTSPGLGDGRYSVEEMRSSQKYRRALFHSCPQNNKDGLQRSSIYDSESSIHKTHMKKNNTRFIAYDHLEAAMGHNSLEQIDEMKSLNLTVKCDLNKQALESRVCSDGLEVDDMLENEINEQRGLHAAYGKKLSPVDGDVIINNYFTFSSSSKPVMREDDKNIHLLGVVDPTSEIGGTEYSSQTIENTNQERSLEESDELHFSIENNGIESEQPSPVSVLDLAYQEDSSLNADCKEIKSELRDIETAVRGEMQLYPCQTEHGMEFDKDSCALTEGTKNGNIDFTKDELAFCDFFLEEVTCSKGNKTGMSYAKDVLLASGFIKHVTSFPASSYGLHQCLNLDLFEKMENFYVEKAKDSQKVEELNVSQRHLIFDSVSEALCNILQTISSKPRNLSRPTSIDIFKRTWSYIQQLLSSHLESQDTLENLVAKDLVKNDHWLNMHLEIEVLEHEMEGAILDDLVEEMLLVM